MFSFPGRGYPLPLALLSLSLLYLAAGLDGLPCCSLQFWFFCFLLDFRTLRDHVVLHWLTGDTLFNLRSDYHQVYVHLDCRAFWPRTYCVPSIWKSEYKDLLWIGCKTSHRLKGLNTLWPDGDTVLRDCGTFGGIKPCW